MEKVTIQTPMMIRKPIAEVFESLIDPEITTNFWFTKSSGKLEKGKKITWEWEMYNISMDVDVIEIIPNKLITFEWGNPKTVVEFQFTPITIDSTYVVIRNYGFHETGSALIAIVNEIAGGFTTVLDGMKAYLEHHIQLNLIADKFPKEVSNHGR